MYLIYIYTYLKTDLDGAESGSDMVVEHAESGSDGHFVVVTVTLVVYVCMYVCVYVVEHAEIGSGMVVSLSFPLKFPHLFYLSFC